MLRRLIFENWAILCTLIAFATALSIFLFIGYRALRMSRKDASRIANIPLDDDEKAVLAKGAHEDSDSDKAERDGRGSLKGGAAGSVTRGEQRNGTTHSD